MYAFIQYRLSFFFAWKEKTITATTYTNSTIFDIEQRRKRSHLHLYCYVISRFSYEWKRERITHTSIRLKRCMRVIRQTKLYNIVFSLEQRLKRSYSHVHCYSTSRFFSEWERRDDRYTHLILYLSYSLNKVLQHRFQSRTKIQAIIFTCALLFDLAFFFNKREKNNTHTQLFDLALFFLNEKEEATHTRFNLKWEIEVIRQTKFYHIAFNLEQKRKRSHSHVHCNSILRIFFEWKKKNNTHIISIWDEKLKLFFAQKFRNYRYFTHYYFFFWIIVFFLSAKRKTIIQRKK
jgi:hypothetical protein